MLKQDALSSGVRIATIFVGADARLFKRRTPLLWETMIFGGKHNGYCKRYGRRKDALAGHVVALEIAKTRSL